MILWCLNWVSVFKYNKTFHRDSHAQSVMHSMHFNTIKRAKKRENWNETREGKKTNQRTNSWWCLVLKAYQRWFHEGISTTLNSNCEWAIAIAVPLKMANVYVQFGRVYHFIHVSVDFIPGKNDEDNVVEEYVSYSLARCTHTCSLYLCWQITDYDLYLARFEFQKLFVPKNWNGSALLGELSWMALGKWW